MDRISQAVARIRDNVPPELRELQVWLLYLEVPGKSGDKPRKIPMYSDGTPRGGPLDSAADRARLVDFEAAAAAAQRIPCTGLGVALGKVPGTGWHLSGIDLDRLGPEPEADPRAREVIAAAASYAETSPSGEGLHVLGLGDIGTMKADRDGLEIYSGGRFFTMTGARLNGAHLADITAAADRARELWSEPSKNKRTKATDAAAPAADGRIVEGKRNHALTREAGRLRRIGLEAIELRAALGAINVNRCEPPLDEEEVGRIAASVSRYAPGAAAATQRAELPDIHVEPVPVSWLHIAPPPQAWAWDQRVPIGAVTALVAEGGAGKSQLALRLAVAVALGRPLGGSQVSPGAVCYVAGEDPSMVMRRRLHTHRTKLGMRLAERVKAGEITEKVAAKRLGEFDDDVTTRLHTLDCVGRDLHLVTTVGGEVFQGPAVELLIEKLRAVADLRLVVLDPLARFHGGDENSNSVMTALVNAAERIAQELNVAVLIVHHVSKAAATEGNVSGHAGRGGSALGDGARSVLRLVVVDKPPAGVRLVHRDPQGISEEMFAAGRVVKLVHAKSNFSARQPDLYLLRGEHGELHFLRTVADGRSDYSRQLEALRRWSAANPGPITRHRITKNRGEVFGGSVSRDDVPGWLEDAEARGDLVRDSDYRDKNPRTVAWRLADTFGPPAIPPGTSAGMPRHAGMGAAGIPPAAPSPRGRRYVAGGIESNDEAPAPGDTSGSIPPKFRPSIKRRPSPKGVS